MKVIRYKPLFSLSATYTMPGTGPSTQGISVRGLVLSEHRMADLKLKPLYKNNLATVFYEGVEMPIGVPVTSEPVIEMGNSVFYFGIELSDKEKIRKLQFHPTPAKAKAIGFPLLYSASITSTSGQPTITAMEEVKVVLSVFTFVAIAADTGITASHAALEIRDEKNVLVDLGIQPAEINDKKVDGPAAVPEFVFSVDASGLDAGIYEFKVGNYKQRLFLANKIDLSNLVALVRVLKNEFLPYHKDLADKTFVQFDLQVPAA